MKEKKVDKKVIAEMANASMALKAKTILTIKTKPSFKAGNKGLYLNDGYDFEVDGALPEIADGIAKFAKELPKNDFGEGSDSYFITLINEYFKKL